MCYYSDELVPLDILAYVCLITVTAVTRQIARRGRFLLEQNIRHLFWARHTRSLIQVLHFVKRGAARGCAVSVETGGGVSAVDWHIAATRQTRNTNLVFRLYMSPALHDLPALWNLTRHSTKLT